MNKFKLNARGDVVQVNDFMWAVKQMKLGKKVTIGERGWYAKISSNHIEYYYKNNNKFVDKNPTIEEINNDNWEIYEEKPKTLWDKLDDPNTLINDEEAWEQGIFHKKDVKEALKEFIEQVEDSHSHKDMPRIRKEAKEIFGEELIK